MRLFCSLLVLTSCVVGGAVSADEIKFNRDIRPILSDKCFACHGPDHNKRQAELRLDRRDDAVRDREGHFAIAPGKTDMSELVARITSDDESTIMPPPETDKPLTKQEIETLVKWISDGAVYEEHWSLLPPVRPEVPTVRQANKVRPPVDAFILRRLEQAQQSFSPEADRRTLIRRLSFDLTGLPPTPEEVDAFVNDQSDNAYEKVVDQLLASPHYGERLAMYWLDLVRYADSLGYHGDQERSVSPYRDYVIRSFNENKPFDQFTIENLAGDLLPEASLWQKVASTYNRLNNASAEGGVQPKEYLAKYAADRVRTTGNVWLGSTFGCAECHDHKFDPFTTKDFYSFEAFFADIREQGIVSGARHIALLPVPTPEQAQRASELDQQIADAQTDYDRKSPERDAAFADWQKSLSKQAEIWKVLTPVSAKSTGGATLEIQEEGRILASGKNPDKDVYELEFKTDLASIGGLRLEILPHDSLPAKGPGRAGNGNLVVKTIEATVNGKPLAWQASAASHSQDQFKGEYVASGNPNGWAILPQTGKANQLVLQGKQAITRTEEATETILKVKIHQHHGTAHTLGHFRFSATPTTEQASPTLFANEELAKLVAIPTQERKPDQQSKLWNAFREQTPLLAELRKTLNTLRDQKTALENSIITTLGTESVAPREIRVLPRGNWMDNSGEVVTPQVPHFLPQPKSEAERLNRLDLAKWMVSPDNPLVARTFVNRMWMLCFGQGIARSVNDLGSQGSWPTHPQLLDWLSVEFVESGWDIKHLFKLMVMSETYRQTSLTSAELRQADPYNELYARQGRWRLDAEMIRDNALEISGLLVSEVGGVSVKPYQPAGYWDQLNFPKRTYQADQGPAQYRRGLYTHWQRTFLHPSLLAFDAPVREECTARRERSNTPIQALVLLNDPTYVEAARKFAERILDNGGDGFDSRLDQAYRLALSRAPEAYERELLQTLYNSNLELYRQDPESAGKLLQTGLSPVEENMDKSELAAWTTISRTILNLHETITRY